MTEKQIYDGCALVLANAFRTLLHLQRERLAAKKQAEIDEESCRDFWLQLTGPGQYFYKQRRNGGEPVRRCMWVHEDLWRIFIGYGRSYSRTDLPGFFLLDIR